MGPNKERLRLLVAALRSGEYSQCTNHLREQSEGKTSYCCLGVATKIAEDSGISLLCSCGRSECGGGWDRGPLPAMVGEWYGISSDPVIGYTGTGGPISAITANDELGWDFAKIADAFESQFDLRGEKV